VNGNLGQLQVLLDRGGDVNATAKNGLTLLQLSVLTNQVKATEMLLAAGASGVNDLARFSKDRTAPRVRLLSAAVWNGHSDLASILIKNGANPNQLDEDGRASLAGAISLGRVDLVNLVLDAGADPNLRWGSGYSAVWHAAVHGRPEILQVLLDRGGDPNSREDHGVTPLIVAIQMERGDAASLLIARGAKIFPLDAWGKSALTYAKAISSPELRTKLVAELRTAGAREGDLTRPIDNEFLKACYEGNLPKVTDALAKGADLYARGQFDGKLLLDNALLVAVKSPKVVQFLLKQGLNPNIKTSYDFTALHSAADEGTSEVIQLLIEKGLNPNQKAKAGQTPLFMAINGRGRPENVAALLNAGANPNVPIGGQGQSLLQFAQSRNKKKIADLLIAAGAQ
jgi:cytohesin